MTHLHESRRRSGFTLLEVLLALGISVVLLSAVYSVLFYQLRLTQAGRDLVEQANLARAVLNKIGNDAVNTLALGEAGRFRVESDASGSEDAASASSSAGGSASTGSSGSTGTGSSSTGGTGTGTGTSGGTSGSTSGSSTSGGTSTESTDPNSASSTGLSGSVQLPLGIMGSSTELHLFVSQLPGELLGTREGPSSGGPACDLRRISYWLAQDGGLCRLEVRSITSNQATDTQVPDGPAPEYQIAPEVKSLEFSYFDGSGWVDSWDSTQVGQDEITPKGSPRAIAIKIAMAIPGNPNETKTYRQVVLIPTAGGTPLETTSSTSTGGGTSP